MPQRSSWSPLPPPTRTPGSSTSEAAIPCSSTTLAHGYRELTVLEISRSAIERAQSRLGTTADTVRWVVGDVLTMGALGTFDVWHDRAPFHFLIDRNQRQQYVAAIVAYASAKRPLRQRWMS